MTRNLREEVDIAPYVERGVIDVSDPAARDNINTLLTGALGLCFLTPYIALEKVRKVLAYYHIFLPKTTFLEGDRGVEVFTVNQFGKLSGMKDSGEVVTKVDSPLSLYFEYKMNDRGMFDIFCEIVTDEELDDLIDNVEDEINDEDVVDDREEKLDEDISGYVVPALAGLTATALSGNPLYTAAGVAVPLVANAIRKRKKPKKIDEDSESVKMAGHETGYKQISGAPAQNMGNCSIGHNVLNKIKMKKKLEEGEVVRLPTKKDRFLKALGDTDGKKSTDGKKPPTSWDVKKWIKDSPVREENDPFKDTQDMGSIHSTQAERDKHITQAEFEKKRIDYDASRVNQPPKTFNQNSIQQRTPASTPSTQKGNDTFVGIKPVSRDQAPNSPLTDFLQGRTDIGLGSTVPNVTNANKPNTDSNYRTMENRPGDEVGIKPQTLPYNPNTTPKPSLKLLPNRPSSSLVSTNKPIRNLGSQVNETISYVRQLAEKHSVKKKS